MSPADTLGASAEGFPDFETGISLNDAVEVVLTGISKIFIKKKMCVIRNACESSYHYLFCPR